MNSDSVSKPAHEAPLEICVLVPNDPIDPPSAYAVGDPAAEIALGNLPGKLHVIPVYGVQAQPPAAIAGVVEEMGQTLYIKNGCRGDGATAEKLLEWYGKLRAALEQGTRYDCTECNGSGVADDTGVETIPCSECKGTGCLLPEQRAAHGYQPAPEPAGGLCDVCEVEYGAGCDSHPTKPDSCDCLEESTEPAVPGPMCTHCNDSGVVASDDGDAMECEWCDAGTAVEDPEPADGELPGCPMPGCTAAGEYLDRDKGLVSCFSELCAMHDGPVSEEVWRALSGVPRRSDAVGEVCHICQRPRNGPGEDYCSAPHLTAELLARLVSATVPQSDAVGEVERELRGWTQRTLKQYEFQNADLKELIRHRGKELERLADKLAGSGAGEPHPCHPCQAHRVTLDGPQPCDAKETCGKYRAYARVTPEPHPDAGELADALAANERDRSKVAEVRSAVLAVIRGYSWATEGRGSYKYDDDEYRREFGRCLQSIKEALVPLTAVAADLTNCPTTQVEVERARLQPEPAPTESHPDPREPHEYDPVCCCGWCNETRRLRRIQPQPANVWAVIDHVDAECTLFARQCDAEDHADNLHLSIADCVELLPIIGFTQPQPAKTPAEVWVRYPYGYKAEIELQSHPPTDVQRRANPGHRCAWELMPVYDAAEVEPAKAPAGALVVNIECPRCGVALEPRQDAFACPRCNGYYGGPDGAAPRISPVHGAAEGKPAKVPAEVWTTRKHILLSPGSTPGFFASLKDALRCTSGIPKEEWIGIPVHGATEGECNGCAEDVPGHDEAACLVYAAERDAALADLAAERKAHNETGLRERALRTRAETAERIVEEDNERLLLAQREINKLRERVAELEREIKGQIHAMATLCGQVVELNHHLNPPPDPGPPEPPKPPRQELDDCPCEECNSWDGLYHSAEGCRKHVLSGGHTCDEFASWLAETAPEENTDA